MKTNIVSIVVISLAFVGCRQLPDLQAEHWVHDGHYGPVATHYEANQVNPQPDGAVRIDSYTGSITVLGGYGVSDTVKGLVYKPSPTPTAPVPNAKLAK